MIKAIVTDFDGTLLNNQGILSERTRRALKKAEEKGILFVAASGRFFPGIHRVIGASLKNGLYCCNNGIWIETKSRDTIHSKSVFSDQELTKLFKEVRVVTNQFPEICAFSCDANYAYTEKSSGDLIAALLKAHTRTISLPSLDMVRKNIGKVSFYCPQGLRKEHLEALKQVGIEHEQIASGHIWFDVQVKGITKAHVFDILAENYGITADEAIVFGDSYNDVEMLAACPNSYAMDNAPEVVKEIAKYIAPSNEADGVAVILESLGIFE